MSRRRNNANDAAGFGNNNRPAKLSLTPGTGIDGPLNYQNKVHFYLYKGATSKLEEELYDCTPQLFFQFVKSLQERAKSYGWTSDDGIMMIKPNDHPSSVAVNLLDRYGTVSLERIKAIESAYVNTVYDPNGSDLDMKMYRKAQDSRMIYECLMASLSLEGKSTLNVHSGQYHINGTPSGLCLFKVLVRESYLDSNATSALIRTQLSNLDDYMPTVGNDIIRFNNHVRQQVKALNARGEQTLDLLTYLFKAYLTCPDEKFTNYITDLQTKHEDNDVVYTPQELMLKAQNKYKTLVTKKQWEAPNQLTEKIVALQAKLETLKRNIDKKRKGGDSGESKKPSKKQKTDGGGNTKKEKPDWLKNHERPAEDKLKQPREWKGNPWYWCCPETGGKCDGKWRFHKPSDCNPEKFKKKMAKTKGKSFEKKKPKITMQEALMKIGEMENDLEGGYESE